MFTALLKKLFKNRIDRFIEVRVNNELERIHQQLWDTAKINGEQKLLKVLPNGTSIFCDTDSIISERIFLEKFESEELDFVTSFLMAGDKFIDIGAHIGLFSIYAAKKVGEEGSVIAFEPTPSTYAQLCENIELNKFPQVKTYQKAVSGTEGQLDFYMIKNGYEAWNSPAPPSKNEPFEKITVPAIQIDNMNELPIDFKEADLVKIDVEGWELDTLRGGKKLLSNKSAPTLMVEFTDENAQNAGTTSKALYEYLEELGYKLYTFNRKKGKLIHSPLKHSYPYENLIAVKNIISVNKRLETN